MRAVVAEAGSVHLVDVDDPTGDAPVMRVAEAGICGSDLHMVSDGMPRVAMGHEFAVHLPGGGLAAVRPTGSCNECDPCRRGFQNGCRLAWGTAHGIAIDGGLADLVAVEDQRLFPMSAGARPVDAALVEPLAIAWHGVRRGDPEPGSTALVVGAGSIGLLTVVALRARGVDVHIVARHGHQSAAAEALGATVVDRPSSSQYLCTFDAVCTQATFDLCVKASAPGGKVVEFGMFWTPVHMTNAMLFKEVSVVPAMGYVHAYGSDDFRQAADHLSAHHTVADVVVTHTFALDDAAEAFRVAADRASGAIKVHLVP
jgi:threonine dehydrogenase-like Zn-dependent dehydrogenase